MQEDFGVSIAGNIYGVVLNDCDERTRLEQAFQQKPYDRPPVAPVVIMKPLCALAGPLPCDVGQDHVASATVALLIARDTAGCTATNAMRHVGAMALAIDFSLPRQDYYRPAIAQAVREGSLALGAWCNPVLPTAIETVVDGQQVHVWGLDRLVRDPATLIADMSAFMTLRAGDVLMIGLAGDAPVVRAGQNVAATAAGLGKVTACLPVKTGEIA